MTTRRQLERVIVHQAICEHAAFDQAEFFQRKLEQERATCDELRRERTTLLSENATLRTEIDLLWETVHGLVDSRAFIRFALRQYQQAIKYDLQRDNPASQEARGIWHSIMDKPHYALQEIQSLIDIISQLRYELKRKKGRKHATR